MFEDGLVESNETLSKPNPWTAALSFVLRGLLAGMLVRGVWSLSCTADGNAFLAKILFSTTMQVATRIAALAVQRFMVFRENPSWILGRALVHYTCFSGTRRTVSPIAEAERLILEYVLSLTSMRCIHRTGPHAARFRTLRPTGFLSHCRRCVHAGDNLTKSSEAFIQGRRFLRFPCGP